MREIFTLLFILPLTIHSQEKIDITCFTLGFVDDYLGRDFVISEKENPKTIDHIHKDEELIIKYLDSLIKVDNLSKNTIENIDFKYFKDSITLNCGNCDEFYFLNSKKLALKINNFYYLKPTEIQEVNNPKPEQLTYFAYLNEKKIKTENQRKSFLYGAFLRYGNIENGAYTITLANSVSKFDVLKKILKKIKCKIIKTTENVDLIPNSQIIYFNTKNNEIISTLNKLLVKN
ncbi:hypothetical protein OX283_006645 [Flavobacterium sp. SUN052]|uniref:hypothetical protein n=1 Tax=Flavobacterium sp. SUN052 TaxID=3002441 RepID=UPI00237E288B|nr:hypothetical protein [Flavobacterium sp. SUN052]MEC4004327.1 hypothetical protein [Flavobacterium sp. SUN052]